MNAIDFIRESALFMAKQRPDVYTPQEAVEELSSAIDTLRTGEHVMECILFTSFVLMRITDADDNEVEEFILSERVSGMFKVESEEGVEAYAYNRAVEGLPHVLDWDLDDDDDDLLG